MVGSDLIAQTTVRAQPLEIPVVMQGGGPPSGLAEMLQQFLEQTIAESPHKASRARKLSGELLFRSAEDPEVAVRIRFAGDRVELRDGADAPAGAARVTADFLSIAHLTTGQESPLRLLARGRLRVRLSPREIPFLLAVIRLLKIEGAGEESRGWVSRHGRWILAGAVAAGGALAVHLITN